MKSAKSPLLSISLKIIGLFAFVCHTNQGFGHRVEYLIGDHNYTTLAVFSILWLISIIVLFTVGFQQRTWIRLFWAVVIALTTAVSYGFYAAGGSELEVLDVLELWQARHETGRAFEHFQHALLKAVIVAVLGFVLIAYPPPKTSFKLQKSFGVFAWLPIVPIFLFSCLIFVKSDRAVAGLPQQFSAASMAAAITYKLAMHEIPARANVTETPVALPKSKHLVYLVDESINPNYLYSETGKLLSSFAKHQHQIADFGVSVSGSNCSARSNAILRLGATRDNLIESVRTSPSIWQYAKKAGYRTVYIDSQATENISTKPNDFQNYMTSAEAKYIDEFHKVKNVPTPELDYYLLEIIKKELANDTPTFIYANKNGAHFPYSANYPKNEEIYQPVITSKIGKGLDDLLAIYKHGEGIDAVINTYKNSIHWTVDKFFKRFFDEIKLDQTVVIYTADHGQNFEPNSTTHCTSGYGAPAIEGLVPMMLITEDKKLLSIFKNAAKTNQNKTDHFSLFPSVLEFFGYSKNLQEKYGPTLLEPARHQYAAFNTGDILGVISKDTIWREVNMEDRVKNLPNLSKQSVSISY